MTISKRNRYVRIRCPICDQVSPTVAQQTDVRRDGMRNWWAEHHCNTTPYPILELAPGPEANP